MPEHAFPSRYVRRKCVRSVLITADYSFSVQKKYHNLQVADNAGLNTYVVAVAKQSDSFWVKKVKTGNKNAK